MLTTFELMLCFIIGYLFGYLYHYKCFQYVNGIVVVVEDSPIRM